MQKINCYECGRSYDCQDEAFCPKCGAFNQPPRSIRIAADGSVERVDGMSESGHEDSFSHQEFHEEEKSRRKSGLSRGVQRIPDVIATVQKKGSTRGMQGWEAIPKDARRMIGWVMAGLVILLFFGPALLNFLFFFLSF